MKWDDYQKTAPMWEELYSNREITEIDCPVCGKKIYRRTDIVLTSLPPQYRYECDCGWTGTGH